MNYSLTENETITEVVLECKSMLVDHSSNAFLPQTSEFSISPTKLCASDHKDPHILTSNFRISTGVHEEFTDHDNLNCGEYILQSMQKISFTCYPHDPKAS